ncbi:hypothetical protein [Lysinibacillus sp. Y5S-8]|uniref:hypothetical protein n=1 Tax=Lysinibacillus sp. Y5S-8 TaxID=3122488 RepID=UPI0030CC9B7B
MSNIEIKYLTKNDEYKSLEITDSTSSTEDGVVSIQSVKEEWKKELASVSGVPEFKTEICYKTIKIPFDGTTKVPYPCLYTRTSRHWIELKVKYPADVANDVKDKIIKCATEGAIFAAAALAPGLVAPEAIPVLIPIAKGAFTLRFSECLAEEIRNTIEIDITHESKSGDWKRV